jgi:hypothetical protein
MDGCIGAEIPTAEADCDGQDICLKSSVLSLLPAVSEYPCGMDTASELNSELHDSWDQTNPRNCGLTAK